ncbi:hypothetical protein, partial [Stutzerimonas stutzeri]|uniref:hypothetical protein n=1 Tax=Stutzerimonas stutzeri TaxID=316 RepID=UPI001CA5240A
EMYGAVETRNPPESGLKWCPPKIGGHHAVIWKKRGDGFGGRLRFSILPGGTACSETVRSALLTAATPARLE